MSWWYWITPISEKAHLHLFFNNDQVESAEGSDILRLTPPEVFAMSYNINEKELADVLAPINQSVVIGPPNSNAAKPWLSNVKNHHDRQNRYGD